MQRAEVRVMTKALNPVVKKVDVQQKAANRPKKSNVAQVKKSAPKLMVKVDNHRNLLQRVDQRPKKTHISMMSKQNGQKTVPQRVFYKFQQYDVGNLPQKCPSSL